MARSSISGFLLGTVVAVGGMAAVSVLQTLNTPIPEAANVNVPAGSGFDGAREDVATSLPAADPVETTTEAARADAPAPEGHRRNPRGGNHACHSAGNRHG